VVVTACIAGRREGNGTSAASAQSIGRVVVVENLDIAPEFKAHFIKVRRGGAGDDRVRTQSIGDAVCPWELVEASHSILDEVDDHKFGQAFEREAVDACARALLQRSVRSFDLAQVTVSGNDVHHDGEDLHADALELIVAVYVTDGEASMLVELDDAAKSPQDGAFASVGHRAYSAVADIARDGMKKWVSLYVDKIDS
jgi:hypothetical protein